MPLTAYITDNMGVLPKKAMRKMHFGALGIVLVSVLLWFLPSGGFDRFLPDLLKHIAVKLICFVATTYLSLYLLKFFGKKYGKFKPFLIFYGPLLLATTTAMVYIPYQSMNYGALLLLVHTITNFINAIASPYSTGVDSLQGRMSSNQQERARLMSIPPIFNGMLREVFGMLFPLFADQFGGQLNIRAYKWIVPLYGLFCMAEGLFVVRAKERVIQAENHVAKVSLRKAVKQIFSNKYLWITNIGGCLNLIGDVQTLVLTWLLLYGTRMQWMTGFAISAFKIFTSPTGNFFAPVVTKRFSKRQSIIGLRVVMGIMTAGLFSAFLTRSASTSEIVPVVLVMVFSGLQTFFSCANDVIHRTITPDIWDYQQWKSGERLEASANLFGYVTAPILLAVGYIMPYLSKQAGLVGDYQILYDEAIRNRVFLLYIIIGVVSNVLPALPFLFYDLTPQKHERIIRDLEERAKAEASAEVSVEGVGAV
ncbi:MAG: MFS transporter, partial [Oscillospiraceae bacterium]|jgi:Na+/melibiose symporter-like transporter|nr:MFS transporter [Oscillospiraceae bacterium]